MLRFCLRYLAFFKIVSFTVSISGTVAWGQTLPAIPDLVLWLDANDINGDGSTSANGTLVSTWVDKTGGGGDATESQSSRQPTVTYGEFDCLPGLYFDNLSLGLQGQFTRPTGQEYTVFILGEMGGSNAGTRNAYIEFENGTRSILFRSHVWPQLLNAPLNLETVDVIRWTETSDSNFSLYESDVANTINGTRTPEWSIVGKTTVNYHLADDRTGGDELEDGYINEVLFHDRILSAAEIASVETYLTDKWKNLTPCVPAKLSVNKSVKISNTGNYFIPGEEVIYNITIVNTGGPNMDSGSVFLVDSLPSEIIFNSDDFNTASSGMGPIEFSAGGTGLTFNHTLDFGVSFSTTKPTSMSQCTDIVDGGLDDRVRHICIQPQGKLSDGTPAPKAIFQFKGVIK